MKIEISQITRRLDFGDALKLGAARRQRQQGFTLLELLIVIAIMAVIAGVSLSFGGRAFGTDKPEIAARQIAQGLRRARSRAIAGNADRALEIDIETRRMQVEGEAVQTLPERLSLEMTTAVTERRTREIGAIRFYPDGSSTGGEITVADSTQAFTVRVAWLTGGVEVVRAPPPDRPRR